jgi:hypothetical protein
VCVSAPSRRGGVHRGHFEGVHGAKGGNILFNNDLLTQQSRIGRRSTGNSAKLGSIFRQAREILRGELWHQVTLLPLRLRLVARRPRKFSLSAQRHWRAAPWRYASSSSSIGSAVIANEMIRALSSV